MQLREPFAEYTFHSFDVSLATVAHLYKKMTVAAIWEANRSAEEYSATRTWEEFEARIEDGSRLLLPVPLEEQLLWWERRPVRGRYANLQAVCDDVNTDPLRSGLEPLHPLQLLRYVRNAELRARHGIDVATLLKGTEGTIPLQADSVVAIPYPPMPIAAVIFAAARSPDRTYDLRDRSTAQTTPRWIRDLYDDFLLPLAVGSLELAEACRACQKIRNEALEELRVLSALQWFLDVQAGDPQGFGQVRLDLTDLQEIALRKMGHDPAAIAECPEDSARRRQSKELTDRLLDPRLGELTQRAFTSANVDILHPDFESLFTFTIVRTTLKALITSVVNRAVLALAISGENRELCADVEAAIDGMGTATRTALQGKTCLQKILSMVGADPGVVNALIGALPDPSLLAVVTISVSAAASLPSLAQDPTVPRPEVGDRLTRALGMAGRLDAAKIANLDAVLKGGSPSDIGRISSSLSALSSTGKLSNQQGLVAFVNAIALVVRLAKGDDDHVRLVADLLNLSASKTAAILKHFSELAPTSNALNKSVQRSLKGFGSVMVIVSGFISFVDGFRGGDLKLVVIGGLNIARGVIGFLTLVFEESVVLPVVGEVLALIAVFLSIFDIDLSFFDLGTNQRIFVELLKSLTASHSARSRSPWFKRVMDKDPELQRAYDRLMRHADEGSLFVYGIIRSEENFAVLRRLLPAESFSDEFIDTKMLETREHRRQRQLPWNQGGLSP